MLCKLLAGCHLLTQIPGEMPHVGMRCGAGCLSHTKKEARSALGLGCASAPRNNACLAFPQALLHASSPVTGAPAWL